MVRLSGSSLLFGEKSYVNSGGSEASNLWSAESGESAADRGLSCVKLVVASRNYRPLEENRLIRVWDLEARRQGLELLPGLARLWKIWFGHLMEHLASGGHDLLVRVWNVTAGNTWGFH